MGKGGGDDGTSNVLVLFLKIVSAINAVYSTFYNRIFNSEKRQQVSFYI